MSQISITYCGTCNYRPIAASLARAVESETGIKPTLVHSAAMGAFEVSLNDEVIFSKITAGRFPDFTSIVDALAKKIGSNE
jgi:selT/selW/selH-like putative selenoprotein